MTTFADLGLPTILVKRLQDINYTEPTPVQEQSIPVILQGKDVLGSAQTGTGKTAAFGLPLISFLMQDPSSSALILTPTRELATQVLDSINKMQPMQINLKSALIIGGGSMRSQLNALSKRPRIIVGTPGRINDHLKRGTLRLDTVKFLVLDETDRMLDMGFGPQLETIVKFLPNERQNLMFSATMPKNITKLSEKYLVNPVRITIGALNAVAINVKQEVLRITEPLKFDLLLSQLRERKGSVVIFVKTKHGADRMAKKLNGENETANAIHGNLSQNQRDSVLRNFRKQEFRILVATDIAARGLDIPHIEHVINYDLPQVPEDYIHRIGRTARAGAIGSAICLISPKDEPLWKDIYKMLNPGQRDPNAGPSENAKPRQNSRGRGRNQSQGQGRGRTEGQRRREEGRGRGMTAHKEKQNSVVAQGPKEECISPNPDGFRAKQKQKKHQKSLAELTRKPVRGKTPRYAAKRKPSFDAPRKSFVK